jgi:hypothetical protein
MRGTLLLIPLLALLSGVCGCLAAPTVFHPGTEAYQQARARKFEPYPENDMGPPVVGARPREYQDQEAEVTRVLRDPHEPVLVPCTPQQAPLAQPQIVQPVFAAPLPAGVYTPPAAMSNLQP